MRDMTGAGVFQDHNKINGLVRTIGVHDKETLTKTLFFLL